jgi:hypothetical protein
MDIHGIYWTVCAVCGVCPEKKWGDLLGWMAVFRGDTDVQTWIEWGALFSDKPISETTNQSGFR